MNVCTQCGRTFYPEDIYCGQCGAKLASGGPASFMTQSEMRVEDVRSSLGVVYFKMGRYAEALSEFQKVLQNNPNDSHASDMIKKIEQLQNG